MEVKEDYTTQKYLLLIPALTTSISCQKFDNVFRLQSPWLESKDFIDFWEPSNFRVYPNQAFGNPLYLPPI